jgi:hypothetical protein
MNNKEIGELILYIVDKVADLGGYTTTIRLVKYLYLIDLEHYRRYGETLTDLKWIYYHYGPYTFSLPDIGSRLGFDLKQEEFHTKQGKSGILFRVQEPQELPGNVSFAAESMINGLLQIWSDQETSELLLYVYNTEPVKQGIQGQELDFSKVSRGSRYYEFNIPVDKKIVKKIRENLKTYALADAEEYVSITTKPITHAQEVLEDLEDKDFRDFPGIYPEISDEHVLRGTLPEGD